MIRRIFFAPLAFALLSTSCYSPNIADGQFTCGSGGPGSCPSGFACRCGLCRPDALTECIDAGMPPLDAGADLARTTDGPALVVPCTNGGMRAPGDFRNPLVALCPAAWAAPGTTGVPSCSRKPTPDGTDGHGKNCSAADNCALGWHVCVDDAELGFRGVIDTDCAGFSQNPQALFVTQQPGTVSPPDGGGQPPPPTCTGALQHHIVFGCGNSGMMAPVCAVLDRALISMPGGGDGCSAETGGNFSCPGVDPMNNKYEATLLVKTRIEGGGVMCCSDSSTP